MSVGRRIGLGLLAVAVALPLGAGPPAAIQDSHRDSDWDGVEDTRDDCPDTPEARNGFADLDGCPDSIDDLLAIAVEDLDRFWMGSLTDRGRRYLPPGQVQAYVGGESTGCGIVDLDAGGWGRNALYCTADHSIYLDRGWMDEEMATGGDFAPVTILAHEWGHLVQAVEGFREEYTIQAELQADCLSGAYARSADIRGMLERGDLQEGLDAAYRAGDASVPWNDPGAHGSPPQRMSAFYLGYRGSELACGDVRSGELGSIIGIPPEVRPEGALAEQIPLAVDGYVLIRTVSVPEMMQRGAIDAIQALYRDARGVEISLHVAAYASEEQCASELERFREAMQVLGYSVVEETPAYDPAGAEIGRRYRLSGPSEVLLWSAGNALGGLEGADFQSLLGFATSMLESLAGPA